MIDYLKTHVSIYMKYYLQFIFLFISSFCFSQAQYDSVLAKKTGADEYGMKKYVLVMLKTGSNTSTANKNFKDSCFKEHLNNIGRLANENKLVVAGPITSKNSNTYRGIFILSVASQSEAIEVLKTDAAIRFKFLDYELFDWYGSAALSTYLENVEKVTKKNF